MKIIKQNGELDSEHFYYVVDMFFLILVDDSVNLKKCYDGGLYKYFMLSARKQHSKEPVRACLFKIVSYLSKYGKHRSVFLELIHIEEEFLRFVQESRIIPAIQQIVDPILENHIQDNTNYTQLNLDRRAKLESNEE